MRLEHRARDRSAPALGALFGGVLAVGAVLAVLWLRLGLPRPVCPLRQWSGIPCPTCGTTRIIEALLSGRFLEALALNPLVFLGLAAIALWAALSTARIVFGLPSWRIVASPRERLALRLLAAAVLVAGWTYVIWRGV